MQTLAVIALVIGIVMLFHWLGTPVRRKPEEKKPTQSPEADIPPPTNPVL